MTGFRDAGFGLDIVDAIDDSDMGCDCREKCKIRDAWTRQIPTIEIMEADAQR